MFSKLFTIAIAIIFWPVTLLIFGWAMLHTFLTTKFNYTPPTDLKPESFEELILVVSGRNRPSVMMNSSPLGCSFSLTAKALTRNRRDRNKSC